MSTQEILDNKELYTADQFCGMMIAERRMWFVVSQLFPGHKHTIKDWIALVSKHDIAVNQQQKTST